MEKSERRITAQEISKCGSNGISNLLNNATLNVIIFFLLLIVHSLKKSKIPRCIDFVVKFLRL